MATRREQVNSALWLELCWAWAGKGFMFVLIPVRIVIIHNSRY